MDFSEEISNLKRKITQATREIKQQETSNEDAIKLCELINSCADTISKLRRLEQPAAQIYYPHGKP